MKTAYFLNTHVVLWWLSEPERLSRAAREAIAHGHHPVYVSAAVAWELTIEKALGRLDFPTNLEHVLAQERIKTLPITVAHALAVADLPRHHQDPFDRVQIAQARIERLTLVTRDAEIEQYDVEVLRA